MLFIAYCQVFLNELYVGIDSKIAFYTYLRVQCIGLVKRRVNHEPTWKKHAIACCCINAKRREAYKN